MTTIQQLRTAAAEAGDMVQVAICEIALHGEIGSDVALDSSERDRVLSRYGTREAALRECERVIADAAAQQ